MVTLIIEVNEPLLFLASKSPRRRALLKQIHVQFDCVNISIDEQTYENESAHVYVERMAIEKAVTGYSELSSSIDYVLGSDTTVVLDGLIMGKPNDYQQARAMLMTLSGKTHKVYTAIALVGQDTMAVDLSVTSVTFRELSEKECRSYWMSGEPVDKAGSYAIQGLGAQFIRNIAGSYSGVMGLPLFETHILLKSFYPECLSFKPKEGLS